MMRILHLVSLAMALMMLFGCSPAPSPPPAAVNSASPRDQLAHLVGNYWDEQRRRDLAGGEDISPQFLADSLALERRYLAAVLAIARPRADPESELTYELFKRERELAIESFTYPSELLPINPFDSMPLKFARIGIGIGVGVGPYRVSNREDYDRWQARADAYVRWTAQAIANMRDGARRGYTVPRVLVEEMLPLLAALGADTAGNVFYRAQNTVAETLPEALRSRFREGIGAGVKEKILPSYRTLHDFLQSDYLPRARASVGLSALPLGEAWYAFLIRKETGTRLTPAQISALGEAEAERLHGRLKVLLAEAGYADNAPGYLDSLRRDPQVAFTTAAELVSFYAGLKAEVAAALPAAFSQAPAADFEIRPLEDLQGAGAPAVSYQPAVPGDEGGGVLYVNVAADAAQPLADAARFLREALPGHQYQLSIQRARPDLPNFRRFGADPAFAAGWGSYAASLGEELGVYRESASKFEALLGQMECAAGLVIDTGLHAQGWSRQRAIDYLHSKLPLDETGVRRTVDRAIALPAEALACTIGERKMQALRAAAEQRLGARFDVRAFHAQLLDDGAVPIDILESNLKRWLDGLQ